MHLHRIVRWVHYPCRASPSPHSCSSTYCKSCSYRISSTPEPSFRSIRDIEGKANPDDSHLYPSLSPCRSVRRRRPSRPVRRACGSPPTAGASAATACTNGFGRSQNRFGRRGCVVPLRGPLRETARWSRPHPSTSESDTGRGPRTFATLETPPSERQATPQATPEATTRATPEATPRATPEATPRATRRRSRAPSATWVFRGASATATFPRRLHSVRNA